jgi:hypothetical protein
MQNNVMEQSRFPRRDLAFDESPKQPGTGTEFTSNITGARIGR